MLKPFQQMGDFNLKRPILLPFSLLFWWNEFFSKNFEMHSVFLGVVLTIICV